MSFTRRIEKLLRSPGRFAAFWLCALFGLAACTTTAQNAGPGVAAATPQTVAEPDRSAPARKTIPATRPPAPPSRPQQLLGMTPIRVAELLGEPKLIRTEPPAQVWLYRNKSCIFHVYLYSLEAAGAYSVSHIAAVSPRGDTVAVDSCFSETVIGAHRKPQDS
jgi:hypothetical protein